MVKKITACVFFLIFTLSVFTYTFAEPADDVSAATPTPQTEQNVPPQGSRDGRTQGNFGGQPPQMPDGNFGGGQVPQTAQNTDNASSPQTSETPGDALPQSPSSQEQTSNTAEGTTSADIATPEEQNESAQPFMNNENGRMPDEGFNNQNTENQIQPTFMRFVKEYITPIISLILLLLAFIFVKFYKRKNY